MNVERRGFLKSLGSALGILASDMNYEGGLKEPVEENSEVIPDSNEFDEEHIEFFKYKSINQDFLQRGDEAIGIRFGGRLNPESLEVRLPYRTLIEQRPELAEDFRRLSSFLGAEDSDNLYRSEKVEILEESTGLEGEKLALYLKDLENEMTEKYNSKYVPEGDKEIDRRSKDGNTVLKIENLDLNPPHWFNFPFNSNQADIGSYNFDSFECHIGPTSAYLHFYEGEEPEDVLSPKKYDKIVNNNIEREERTNLSTEEEIVYKVFK